MAMVLICLAFIMYLDLKLENSRNNNKTRVTRHRMVTSTWEHFKAMEVVVEEEEEEKELRRKHGAVN